MSPSGPSAGRKGSVVALVLVAAVAAGLFVAVYVAAMQTGPGRSFDDSAIVSTADPHTLARAQSAGSALLRTIDVTSLAIFGLGAVGFAVLRRRLAAAAGAAVTLVGANVTTQWLKPYLAHADLLDLGSERVAAASFPSGHATVAMSLALALLIVSPTRMRLAAALAGAAYSGAVGVALVALGWHFPSDVAGGFLCAAAWAGAASAVVAGVERRTGARPGRPLRPAYLVAAIAVAGIAFVAASAVAASRRPDLFSVVSLHTTFFAAAVAIVALACVVVGAMNVALPRRA